MSAGNGVAVSGSAVDPAVGEANWAIWLVGAIEGVAAGVFVAGRAPTPGAELWSKAAGPGLCVAPDWGSGAEQLASSEIAARPKAIHGRPSRSSGERFIN
jgi:hypothetical protein